MIALHGVSKRYGEGAKAKWALQGLDLRIPVPGTVAVIGEKGSGKSTLLRIIAGLDKPTEGAMEGRLRVMYPTRFLKNLQRTLTGRQNARFICRISGCDADLEQRLERIEQIARLGPRFDKPVSTYTGRMKAQLSFALSWVLEFDVYVADSYNFAGESAFGSKERAEPELARRFERATLLMTVGRTNLENLLKERCTSAIWMHDGKAEWFDRLDDGLAAARAARAAAGKPAEGEGEGQGEDKPRKRKEKNRRAQPDEAALQAADERRSARQPDVPEALQPALARIKRMQTSLLQLTRGLAGTAALVDARNLPRTLRFAQEAGLELVTREEAAGRGVTLPPDATPVLRTTSDDAQEVAYFHLLGRDGAEAGAPAPQQATTDLP